MTSSRNRILLIEDDPSFQALVKSALGANFEFVAVTTHKQALLELKSFDFQLVIVDLTLPDGDGLDICHQARQNPNYDAIPIIVLTGRHHVADKVAGFSLGIDDYIEKPFNPIEFKARVESKIQKAKASAGPVVIRKGPLTVYSDEHRVTIEGNDGSKTLDLTPIEFRLLVQLMKADGRVLSRDQILDSVWGPNTHVLDRTIDKHICSLRQKLGSLSEWLQTISGSGYRFNSSVTIDPLKVAA